MKSVSGSRCRTVINAVALVMVACSIVRVCRAWEGHDWNEWKATTTWTKPELKTSQTGRKELVELLAVEGTPLRRVDEIRGWEQRRTEIAAAIQAVLGRPSGLTPPRPEAKVLGEETLPDHIRRHVRIRTEADDWIPAYLLLPKDVPQGRLPTMICLHQTVAQGKDEPCGIKGSGDLSLALQLVRRGYVCIAPDVIGFGERIPAGSAPYHNSIAFYRKHPGWSFMGKMIWDVSRVVDWLETQPYVDPLQIGCIGHSHGAYGSIFAGAFEMRISAVIASCGFTTLRSDPDPDRWSHKTALIPQLGIYLPDVASIPFDWQQICALVAPRPLYVWYTTRDSIFPNTDNLEALFKDVRSVYGLYGAANDLVWSFQESGHEFPSAAREAAYRWLDQRFFAVGDLHAQPADLKEWQNRREMLKRVIRRTIGAPSTQPVSPEVEVISQETLPKYERRLIEYSVEQGERIRAFLCVPSERSEPTPAILVFHQTAAEGKREAAGLAGDKSLAFGMELAERGYVTLSPDSITAGERIDGYGAFDTRGHYLRHPDMSAMGKMLHDAQRALDVLMAVEGVDRNRIGAIGHSLGAEETLMLAAFDDRVAAVVASCGYATFRAETAESRLRWARDHWFSYMPGLRPVFQAGRLPHWDWDDVLRLAAPRAVFQYNTRDDEIFIESESAFDAGETARAIWRLYGKEDLPANVLRPGRHAIAEQDKPEMYEWLDRQLKERR